jgi:chromosome segregation ATPase
LLRLGKEVKELERERSKLGVEVNPLQEQLTMLQGQVKDQEIRLKETAPDKKKVSSGTGSSYFIFSFQYCTR